MYVKKITSTSNPLINRLVGLKEKSRNRKQEGKFLVEGLRECGLALDNGFVPDLAVFDPQMTSMAQVEELLGKHQPELIEVSTAIFEKVAYRTSIPNVLLLGSMPEYCLDDFSPSADALVLVLDVVEKPGNLGAMLRTADAAGAELVIVCDPMTDLYNPNTVRSSVGCLFTVPVVVCSDEAAQAWLSKYQFQTYLTHLEASKPLYEIAFEGRSAVVMGSESAGARDTWTQFATQRIIIPMFGKVDSMNVSVSAAIVLYEALRQKLAKTKR
jgi:TrmH family RNA methyltransferase